jgi:MoaA/NifB/PqqE/SkfB family radical SAM enzyme
VIRESEQLGAVTVVFTGGEPLLRPDIYDLIRWVDKDEAVALMFCNGLLLTQENVRKLADAGLWCIHVSIDSPDAKAHDEMRRAPGCFDKAIEGLKRAKDAGMLAGISTYATPERLHNGQVVEMIELARSMWLDEITVFDVVPTGRLLLEDRKHLLNEEDKAELCRLEDEYNKDHLPPLVITQAHVNGPTGVGCYGGWCQFYVTAQGELTPCDFTPLTFGNVRDESVGEAWARLSGHEEYCEHRSSCRMQNAEFRAKWVDSIPLSGPFPYPISEVDKVPATSPAASGERVGDYPSIGIKG